MMRKTPTDWRRRLQESDAARAWMRRIMRATPRAHRPDARDLASDLWNDSSFDDLPLSVLRHIAEDVVAEFEAFDAMRRPRRTN